MQDTIFALSTVYGKSGVAVFRISGSKAYKIKEIFNINKKIIPRYTYLTNLIYDGGLVDNVIVINFAAPNSFTGEDVFEIHSHGGIAVIDKITKCLNTVFRLAEPGEFSKRAFYNGKMDLTQAEGIADLIDAETEMQLKLAANQMSGSIKNLYDKWRQDLVKSMSLLEAIIDFPNEDIPHEVIDEVSDIIINLKSNIISHIDNKYGEIIRSGIKIAIIGPPNVGKSTLLNVLANREVAIVSDISGTTRDIIEVNMDINGYPVKLFDTAGINDTTQNTIELIGINKAKELAYNADLKLLLFDIHKLPSTTNNILEIIDDNTLCVVNKVDHMKWCDIEDITYKNINMTPISAYMKLGIDKLIEKIYSIISKTIYAPDSPCVTRERYRKYLENALYYIEEFNFKKPIELASEDLRCAANNIGKITGDIDVEELLDEVFSNFCIGK